MPEQVFITGASGYVGGRIAQSYDADGVPVENLSRSASPVGTHHPIDLAAAEPSISVKNGAETVLIHSAASMNTGDPDLLWKVNVEGTKNLLSWAAKQKISHLVLIGTGGVYPYRDEYAWLESDSVDPIGDYGYSKYISESVARMHAARNDFRVTVLRLFFPFDLEGEGGMGRLFVNRLRQNLEFQINEGGKPAMNPVFIEDFVDLVRLAVQRESGNGYEVFNAGGAETITFLDMCRFFETRTGKTAKLKQTGNTQQDLIGSIDKARNELGWSPSFRFNL